MFSLFPSSSVVNIVARKKKSHPFLILLSMDLLFFSLSLSLFYNHDDRREKDSLLLVPPARAHRYYTGPELYRHKNVMKRLRTGRGRQMARKIKENGNNGQRTTGQANIFVFLATIRVAQRSVYYFCLDRHVSSIFLQNFFLQNFQNISFSIESLDVIFTSLRKFL